jgi:predicted Zn-dependent protease
VAPGASAVERAQSAAAEAVRFNEKEYAYSRSLGAALYRSAHYEDAVKELTRALTLRDRPSPAVWLLLALAHERCGRGDQARESLGKSRDWIAQARLRKSNDKTGPAWGQLPWGERLALELLLSEAETTIGSAPKKSPG